MFTRQQIQAIKDSPKGKLPKFVEGYVVRMTKGPRTMKVGATGHPQWYASRESAPKGPRQYRDGRTAGLRGLSRKAPLRK